MIDSVRNPGRWIAVMFGVSALLLIAERLRWLDQVAPYAITPVLVTCFWPLWRAWKGSQGLGLRPAVGWGIVAISLAIAGQIAGCWESLDWGRPNAGHWVYVSSLATIAALLSVFNARTPGGGAWAILMVLLIIVMLVPWVEGSGFRGEGTALDRLHLDAPWSWFFLLLALAGLTNYFPTRFGGAALCIGVFLGVELVSLIWVPSLAWKRATLWSIGPWFLALGIWRADFASRDVNSAEPGLPRLWFWFRDYWGVIWALRVMERFNRAAETTSWPIKIAWQGPVVSDETVSDETRSAAEATFKSLLRRFAVSHRITQASGRFASKACDVVAPGGT